MTNSRSFCIAAVQAAPVFLDRDATVAKACTLIEAAAKHGASIVAFPEFFIPAYPDWVWLPISTGQSGALHNALYAELLTNSVAVPSPATDLLCEAARRAGVYVVMGISEVNSEASSGSLYNTLLYIGPDGSILGKHRKLVPTAGERLVWAQGEGADIEVYETPFGRLGGLICWENYMPLARYALYASGVQIYVAATWDCSDTWLATMRHIAKEGRMYVLGCCTAMRNADIPARFAWKQEYYSDDAEWVNPGRSVVVDPDGTIVAGPLENSEDILYADIDPKVLLSAKRLLDVAGHYARPDVFDFRMRRGPRPMMGLIDDDEDVG